MTVQPIHRIHRVPVGDPHFVTAKGSPVFHVTLGRLTKTGQLAKADATICKRRSNRFKAHRQFGPRLCLDCRDAVNARNLWARLPEQLPRTLAYVSNDQLQAMAPRRKSRAPIPGLGSINSATGAERRRARRADDNEIIRAAYADARRPA